MKQILAPDTFSKNLRSLMGSEASTAALCRQIGINRQQFNKYLAGEHLPSRRNLALIARHFGVAEKDLFLPVERFSAIHATSRTAWLGAVMSAPSFSSFDRLAAQSAASMADLTGVYVRYHCSSIYDRKILRSILSVQVVDGALSYRCIERFQDLDRPNRTAYRFRYEGLCTIIEDRLYLMDIENRQLNEMTFTILTPVVRKPLRFLFGTLMGIAATSFREPFATRVAVEFRHHGTILPSDLRLARTVETDDPSIPFEVKAYLGVGNGRFGEIVRGR